MSKIKGHGAYWIKLGEAGVPAGYDYVGLAFHNMEWELITSVELKIFRSWGCRGWTEALPRFRKVESASFSVCQEDEFYPMALGITEGTEQDFLLRHGAKNEFDRLEAAVVESVRIVNDQKKARVIQIVCKAGRLTRAVGPARAFDPLTGGRPLIDQMQDPEEE